MLKFSINPDGKIFKSHSFGEIIVQHICDDPGHFFSVVLAHHHHPLLKYRVKNLIVFHIIALDTGKKCRHFQHDHSEGKYIAFFKNVLLVDIFFSQPQPNQQFRRRKGLLLHLQFLIGRMLDEFIWQHFEDPIFVEYVMRVDIFVSYVVLLQKSQSEDD